MDAVNITQIISTLGFPIAACIALFWKMNKQDETHREETESLRKTIENNTLILTKLYERLGGNDHE